VEEDPVPLEVDAGADLAQASTGMMRGSFATGSSTSTSYAGFARIVPRFSASLYAAFSIFRCVIFELGLSSSWSK
jgi:hypothetical protein